MGSSCPLLCQSGTVLWHFRLIYESLIVMLQGRVLVSEGPGKEAVEVYKPSSGEYGKGAVARPTIGEAADG